MFAAVGALAAGLVAGGLDASRPVWFWTLVLALAVALGAAVVVAWDRTSSLVAVVVSPLSLAVATWLSLFVIRPIELFLVPEHAVSPLAALGFGPAELTRTVAFGALGCIAWSVGYLLAVGSPTPRWSDEQVPASIVPMRAAPLLAIGTVLWFVLFLRQGGFGALHDAAVTVRANQRASFYAFIGVWIVQGVALLALVATVQRRRRGTTVVLVAAITVSLLAATALQLRGLFAYECLAAAAAYVVLSKRRRSRVAALVGVALVGVIALAAFQQVRGYTHFVSTREAFRLTLNTPPSALFDTDLSLYDNFVAMQSLVPESIPYLGGRTLIDIPLSLIPRSLWPQKPLGIDFDVSTYLYPGATTGAPITMQGELFWNGGGAAVLVGSFLIGLLFGLYARAGLRARPGSAAFVVYLAVWPFTYAILTRSLAVMTENVVFAVVGVGLVLVFAPSRPPVAWRRVSAVRQRGRDALGRAVPGRH